ncbi:MAG: hypothetical protein ACXWC8_23445 [Limisphaerales bacterium]
MRGEILLITVAIASVSAAAAAEPLGLRDAKREFKSIKYPTEVDRVRYVTRLVRLRESFTRKDFEIMSAIDAEVIRHPMPKVAAAQSLSKRLIGRWQSPRRAYFYHANGTWASDEDTPQNIDGTWRIEGNRFFQNYRGEGPDRGEKIILLTATDFVYGTKRAPLYLRRGTAFPWRY